MENEKHITQEQRYTICVTATVSYNRFVELQCKGSIPLYLLEQTSFCLVF